VSFDDDDVGCSMESILKNEGLVDNKPREGPPSQDLPKEWWTLRDLPIENIIGDIEKGVSTRRSLSLFCEHMAFVSQVEPLTVDDALKDEFWIMSMKKWCMGIGSYH